MDIMEEEQDTGKNSSCILSEKNTNACRLLEVTNYFGASLDNYNSGEGTDSYGLLGNVCAPEKKSSNTCGVSENILSASEKSCLYLVVYDFLYKKEQEVDSNESGSESCEYDSSSVNNSKKESSEKYGFKTWDEEQKETYKIMLMYQNLIPGESDEIFYPPTATKTHSGPRALLVENSETDAAQANLDYSLTPEKSISDYIIEIKNSKSGKNLNYSRAIQCVSLPSTLAHRADVGVSAVLPTNDGQGVVVVVGGAVGALILYELDFSGRAVTVKERPVAVREMVGGERPAEVTLLGPGEGKGRAEGAAIVVCEDGVVRVVELEGLETVAVARLDGERFVSAVYCNSEYSFFFLRKPRRAKQKNILFSTCIC